MSVESREQYEYRALFFDYMERGARRSARAIIPHVKRALRCTSVLDVGCGPAAWLAEYQAAGVADVIGVDGDYVNRDRLLVPREQFRPLDVSQPFDLGRRFELVQSLEVAEHLSPQSSATFVRNLVAHGDLASCSPRPCLARAARTTPTSRRSSSGVASSPNTGSCRSTSSARSWLATATSRLGTRYNTLLYVRDTSVDTLPAEVRNARVPENARIPAAAPLSYQIRCALLKPLPVWLVSWLAVIKHRLVVARRGHES